MPDGHRCGCGKTAPTSDGRRASFRGVRRQLGRRAPSLGARPQLGRAAPPRGFRDSSEKGSTGAGRARTINDMTMTEQRRPAGGVTATTGNSSATMPVRASTEALGMIVTFDDSDTAVDTLDSLILTAFVDGGQPRALTQRLDQVRDDATLLPP